MLFEQNVDPKKVQKLMGHRDIKTTLKIYYSIIKEALADAVMMIDPSAVANLAEQDVPATEKSEILK